jgi:ABC-type multidrug transport system ATPase subunit/pSer/pThr/pTyr-binding forkhead associated (FHA) protein
MGSYGRIRVVEGKSAGAVHDLRSARTSVGRDPSAAIHLPDPTVSKDQALLVAGPSGIVLENRSPRNPPLVNGEAISGPRPLRDGDEIVIGSVKLAFEAAAPPPPPPRARSSAPRAAPAEPASLDGGAHGTKMLRRPWLVVSFPGGAPREESLFSDEMTLGRADGCNIQVEFPTVSGRHAKFTTHGGRTTVEDLGSTNGTSLNGKTLEAPHELADGDILRIGDLSGNSVSLTYREEGAELRDALSSAPARRLHVEGKDSFVLGRDPACDVALEGSLVSWRHARVERTADGHAVVDLNSTNGTFVNGQRVSGRQALKPNDVIHVGPFKFVYTAAGFSQSSSAGRVRVDGLKIRRAVGRGKTARVLLNDISITIQPREFVCFVGGSGAGKSTLMKAFAGIFHVEGRVLVNGEDLVENYDAWKGMLGYVPQDDIVHGDLTVDHAVRYAARLRLPKDLRKADIDRAVDRVLGDVEMLPHRDKLIRSLSGGQRKRVSIAVEMLSEPSLFFLDEPTSGLDPGLEKKMMYMMRRLADGGRTILMVTHATANITQCDHVAFLARGRLVWFGPPAEALDHFGVRDFSDIYTEIEKDPEGLELKYRTSKAHRKWVVERQKSVSTTETGRLRAGGGKPPVLEKRTAGAFRQFFILTKRYAELVFRDRLLLMILLAVMPVIGLMLAAISRSRDLTGLDPAGVAAELGKETESKISMFAVVGDAQKLLFMTALAVVLLGLFGAAYEIVKERAVYRRERMVNLKIGPYLLSKVVVLLGFALVQCAALLGTMMLRLDLPPDGILPMPGYAEMYVTLVLTALAAILMGLFVSTIAPNANTVIYVVLMAVFSQILFTGVIFELKKAEPVSYAMVTRWSVEGLGSTVDMERLNTQSRTRIGLRKDVEIDLEKTIPIRADDLGPTVGKLLKDAGMEDQLKPVEIREKVRQTFPKEGDPPWDVDSPAKFVLKYGHDRAHLVFLWCGLAGFAAVFALLTCLVLWWRDRQEG